MFFFYYYNYSKLYEIETILDFFPKILNVDENDIFNYSKNSPLWKNL